MIAITGATGNTGSVAAKALLAKGEKVRAIGHHQQRLQPLVALGAEAFVGNASDAASMTTAFKNADAVYLMIPPSMEAENYRAYQNGISDAYAAAIKASGVKYVVALSSLGAQHPQGTGPIRRAPRPGTKTQRHIRAQRAASAPGELYAESASHY